LRHLNSLGRLGDEALAAQVLELCLTEIRSQNAPYLIGSMLSNRRIGELAWRFVTEHFDEAVERFPENSIHRMVEGVVGLAQVDGAGEAIHASGVRSFLDSHVVGGRRRLVAQSLERLEVNVRFARRLPDELADLLAGR
jgi:puromycin-sensitive aminopeptidase